MEVALGEGLQEVNWCCGRELGPAVVLTLRSTAFEDTGTAGVGAAVADPAN